MTAPITPAERALLPDILRGLAIGGILLVNLQNFAGYVPWEQTGVNAAAQAFIDFFANGKFVSTFAMLFGAGAALFVARAGRSRFARRLVALLLIGLAHGTLVWVGDIIANYAVVAFALLPLLLLPRVGLMIVTVLLLSLTALQTAVLAAISGGELATPSFLGVNAIYQHPSYLVVLPARTAEFLQNLTGSVMLYGPWLIGLFLLGALIARTGVLHHPERHQRALTLTALLALLVGVPLNLAFTRASMSPALDAQMWGILLRFTGGLAFALLYGALIALLVARGKGTWLRPFANVGRLALSNYLLTSIILTLVFNGYGLGWYGRVGALPSLLLGVALFTGQVLLSGWYLRRYSRGPAEWLLRRLTYGKA